MEFSVLWSVLLLLILSQTSRYECCSCILRHPQEAFCTAGFVLKGMAISNKYTKKADNAEMYRQFGIPVPIFSYQDILVMKVMKGNVTSQESTYSNFFKITIRTSSYGAQCGLTLKKSKTYLISGRQSNGLFYINQCDWVEEYSKLSKQMRKGIRGEYDCSCSIATCFDGHCTNNSPCQWNSNLEQPMDECTQKYRTCRKIIDKCHWVDHKFYDKCHKTQVLQTILP